MDFLKEIRKITSVIDFENTKNQSFDCIPTGIFVVDRILGGGLPCGRISEIYGRESVGKSALAILAAANAQKRGAVVYLDLEHGLNIDFVRSAGISFDKFFVVQPDCAEEAFKVIDKSACKDVSLIVVDSVAALSPRAELEGEFGDANIGIVARIMSSGLRKIIPKLSDSMTALLFINQVRDKIGVMGSGVITPGGNALRFYASVRLELKPVGLERDDGVVTGIRVKAMVTKHKLFVPFGVCEYIIDYRHGILSKQATLELAVDLGVIKKTGAWYEFCDKKYHGIENLMRSIEENEVVVAIQSKT